MLEKMSPVLKWAGGKTQLLEQIAAKMPSEYNHYYEPFIGSAAVLFGISPAPFFDYTMDGFMKHPDKAA